MEKDARYTIYIRSRSLFGGFLFSAGPPPVQHSSNSNVRHWPRLQHSQPNPSPPCRYFCLQFAISPSATLRLGLDCPLWALWISEWGCFSLGTIIRIKHFLSDGCITASLLLFADRAEFLLPQNTAHISNYTCHRLLFRNDVHTFDGAFVTIQNYT